MNPSEVLRQAKEMWLNLDTWALPVWKSSTETERLAFSYLRRANFDIDRAIALAEAEE